MKSGSSCDLELDFEMDAEYLDSSVEEWELNEDIKFLEEPSKKRTTDATDVIESLSPTLQSQESTSAYSYNHNSVFTPNPKMKYLQDLAQTGNQLAQNMTKIVELAEKGESHHAGFLGHLSSIMDELSKKDLIEFQSRVMSIAYEILTAKE